MWYDRYDDDDLDNHHPTCKGGCNQLADECMCNFDYNTGTWKTRKPIMTEFERLLADNVNPPTTQCLLTNSHEPHEWWYTAWGGGHMLDSIRESDLKYEKGLKKHKCPGLDTTPVDNVGWTSDHLM